MSTWVRNEVSDLQFSYALRLGRELLIIGARSLFIDAGLIFVLSALEYGIVFVAKREARNTWRKKQKKKDFLEGIS